MNFLEECVESFDKMDQTCRKSCDDLWDSISLKVQDQKLTASGILDPEKRSKILNDLKQRPAFLVHVAKKVVSLGHEMGTIAEVGTAQGLQSIVFSKAFPDAHVYTCDIKDDRDSSFSSYPNLKFVPGDSLALNKELRERGRRVDFCWVDGSHDNYAVLDDFLSLSTCAHRSTIWAFDDYDTRFGCFRDLNILLRHFEESIVLDLGLTASGNPNRIILARKLK